MAQASGAALRGGACALEPVPAPVFQLEKISSLEEADFQVLNMRLSAAAAAFLRDLQLEKISSLEIKISSSRGCAAGPRRRTVDCSVQCRSALTIATHAKL